MFFSVLRITTYVLGIVALTMLLPLAVAVSESETAAAYAFLVPQLVAILSAVVFRFAARGKQEAFDIHNAFGTVAWIWVAICLYGAIPLYFSGAYPSVVDAIFESVSGFTATGASVSANVEAMPRSIILWRCQTHWLGGLGVIALAVALIPLLGVSGLRLIKAETSGPEKEKLTNFIATTAKTLWFIYLILTVLEFILLHFFGIDYIDALAISFSTLGSGGFSPRNASIGSYAMPAVEWTCIVFMLASAINFAVYYRLLSGRHSDVRRDSELRVFLAVVAVAIVGALLLQLDGAQKFGNAVRPIIFQVVSVVSTTGFMTEDYLTWCPGAQMVIFILCFIGGCSGSTAGGVKVVRWTVLAKQLRNQVRRMVHPHEVFTIQLHGVSGREEVVPVVAAFVFVYFLFVAVTALVGAIAGLDMFTAFTAALSMVGNIGPAFGTLGPSENYSSLAPALKGFYSFAMLAGRLEIYTLLFLLGRIFSLRPSFMHKTKTQD